MKQLEYEESCYDSLRGRMSEQEIKEKKEEDLVCEYVRERLMDLQQHRNESSVRYELAILRRGIGKNPRDLPELWSLLFRDLPEELMSETGEPTWAEWAISGALTCYALHQLGMRQNAHAEGHRVGMAIRKIAGDDEASIRAIQYRFGKAATASDMPECMQYLSGLVKLLCNEEISLDYVELAGDLYELQTPDRASCVRLCWGQDFYRVTFKSKGEKEFLRALHAGKEIYHDPMAELDD